MFKSIRLEHFLRLHYRSKRRQKKKNRFWRKFRRLFLGRKKLKVFIRFKWLFEQRRLIIRQFSSLYGSKIKHRLHGVVKGKFAFGVRFSNFLYYLELRLNILIIRLRLIGKVVLANYLIGLKLICVNGNCKHKHYLVKIGDIFRFLFKTRGKIFLWQTNHRIDRIRWRRKRWFTFAFKRRKSLSRKKSLRIFQLWWGKKHTNIINFFEMNYRVGVGILLRKPILYEFLIAKQKRMISLLILKKLYLSY